jgi:hypothetical protein
MTVSILAMSASKSIEAMEARLSEVWKEMTAEFMRQNPAHPLVTEANVLGEAKRKLSAINGAAPKIGGGLQRKIPAKRGGSEPKGQVSQHDAAEAAVRATGHPLTIAELVQALPAHGTTPSPRNAEANLTSIISRRGNLRSIRWRDKRAWWLKDKEPPE